jgi:ATP-binding cassette, subfamily B, bacterial
MKELLAVSWPIARAGELVEALANKGGISISPGKTAAISFRSKNLALEAVESWLNDISEPLGIDFKKAEIFYGNIREVFQKGDLSILYLPHESEGRLLGVVAGGSKFHVLGPDLKVHSFSCEAIGEVLRRDVQSPLQEKVDRLVANVSNSQRARESLFAKMLGGKKLTCCWFLRPSPSTSFRDQLRVAWIPSKLVCLLSLHGLQYVLWLFSWWVIGSSVFAGYLSFSTLTTWFLILLTIIPIRSVITWLTGSVSFEFGKLLKHRLLSGILKSTPEEIRHKGVGQLLGQVLEIDSLETLSINGGFAVLFSCIELLVALVVLYFGVASFWHSIFLGTWMLATLALMLNYVKRQRSWTSTRLEITHKLIEQMNGHRTRLVQLGREDWRRGEDERLSNYLRESEELNRLSVKLGVFISRGWLLVGLVTLIPYFIGSASPEMLAVSLGGVLLAYGAFQNLTVGLPKISGAIIAWNRVSVLFHAASRSTNASQPEMSIFEDAANGEAKIIEARELTFKYSPSNRLILNHCNLAIRKGDRFVLEGKSGSGKSTFASILTGLRKPSSGLLLVRGLDFATLGSQQWSRFVVCAPQYHENHVLGGTFAFNALMGDRWPPTPKDLIEVQEICTELGLENLIERMPSGLMQMVGESGWQLSHGERSRLYIARAILQKADLVILDESFAALDPENLQRCIECVLKRCPTFLVISQA